MTTGGTGSPTRAGSDRTVPASIGLGRAGLGGAGLGRAVLEIAARMPAALLPVALTAAIGLSTRSPFTTGVVMAAAVAALGLSGPLGTAAAERWGRRPVLLTGAAAHVTSLVLLVTAVDRFTHAHTLTSDVTLFVMVMGCAALAGATVPPVSAAARDRWCALRLTAEQGLRQDGNREDLALLAAALLTAVLTWSAGPTAGLLAAAAVTAAAVPLYAMDATIGALDEAEQHSSRSTEDDAEPPLCTLLAGIDAARRQAEAGAADGGPVRSRRLRVAVLVRAVLLGGSTALLWILVLDSALSVYRGAWSASLTIAAMLAAGAAASRWFPSAGDRVRASRRRRLLTTLTVLLVGLTATASTLMSALSTVLGGRAGLVIVSCAAVLAAAAIGALLVELYRQVGPAGAEDGSSDRDSSETLLSGALLAGSVLGFAAGGLILALIG